MFVFIAYEPVNFELLEKCAMTLKSLANNQRDYERERFNEER